MSSRWCGLILLFCAQYAGAWGPHTEINRAALAVLPEDAAIRAVLGKDLAAMEKTCWLPDGRRGARADYFPDDYLLFPASPREIDHLNPDVRNAFEPFFHRAVQALRTETPANAARWVGALVHYVQDIGAPPHAASISGELHSRSENWLDVKAIQIDGYRPKFLGRDEASSLQGMLRRVSALSDYATERAERLRKPIMVLAEREDQPLILECALESARASADLLLTLGELARSSPGGATFRGTVAGADTAYFPDVAARVMLLGTPFSTGADKGRFEFRNLPPGRHRLAVLRPGNPVWTGEVELVRDQVTAVAVELRPSDPPGNRLRNFDFSLRWVNPNAPDCWRPLTVGYPDKPSPQPGWQSETTRIKPGQRYRIGAEPAGDAPIILAVRWREFEVAYKNAHDQRIEEPRGHVLTAPENAKFLQVLILTKEDPAKVCRRVWWVEEAP